MQNIVMHLIFQDLKIRKVWEFSPRIDFSRSPLEDVLRTLDDQTHRRFSKTHLPLDSLRYDEQVKYIVIHRDPRDVFMSYWNHYRHLPGNKDPKYQTMPKDDPDYFPPCPEDIYICWRD